MSTSLTSANPPLEPYGLSRPLLLEKGESSRSAPCLPPLPNPIIDISNEPLLISSVPPLIFAPLPGDSSSLVRHSLMVDKIAEAHTSSFHRDLSIRDSLADNRDLFLEVEDDMMLGGTIVMPDWKC